MKSFHYATTDSELLVTSLRPEGPIHVAESDSSKSIDRATRNALVSLQIAQRIGVATPSESVLGATPYSRDSDTVVFPAVILSGLIGRDAYFLRGWQHFQSCIKGFNALGLIAEQVAEWIEQERKLPSSDQKRLRTEFLQSKGLILADSENYQSVATLDLAIWHCFSRRPIVCSTSSNMGISIHEILRLLQTTVGSCDAGSYTILNEMEGSLIIWCPDERADFMNSEKAELLRSLESELPKLTQLRTYINRQQRDPGALRDALDSGGYFFPTNPQSANELQNLLYGALVGVSNEAEKAIRVVLDEPNALKTLESLGCAVDVVNYTIEIRKGVEGGIHGLMVPYWLLAEEISHFREPKSLDVWNQASIGAALAAAVLAERVLVNPGLLSSETHSQFVNQFPRIASLFPTISKHSQSRRILGVFDIANLQSLAQLLGVTVPRHTAGRSTAFVGLGSSSYSNGNRCFEILDESATTDGPFSGRSNFLAATHTLSPVAQALIVGEELHRIFGESSALKTPEDERFDLIRKPEPAGAAALAGVLLRMLDLGQLTVFEIASTLNHLGFNSARFLRLHGLSPTSDSEQLFLQSASEEGPYMAQFAADLLSLMDWPSETLMSHAAKQVSSRDQTPSQDELADSNLVIYLTGDNCKQPSTMLLKEILEGSGYRKHHDHNS